MKELIDLYSKLVIGTFTFIGPSFTLLIPLFYSAIEKSREKHQGMLKNLQISIEQNLQNNTGDFASQIEDSNKKLKKLLKQNQKEINLMRPRRQIRRLFIGLFISIGFIGCYDFQHSHFWGYDYQNLRVACLVISALSFVYCLRVLWQVFCTIIRIKEEEAKSKRPIRTALFRRVSPEDEAK